MTGGKRGAAPRRDAFSLVELTLALAIIAFVFTALIGVLPIALGTYREAMTANIRAEITRQVLGEIQQTPFTKFEHTADQEVTRYFSAEGQPVDTAGEALYRLVYRVGRHPQVFGYENTFLRPVSLRIYSPPEAEAPTYETSVLIADNGMRPASSAP